MRLWSRWPARDDDARSSRITGRVAVLALAALVLLAASPAYGDPPPPPPPDPDNVGLWHLDAPDTSNYVVDSSGFGNYGETTGPGVSYQPGGRFGDFLRFVQAPPSGDGVVVPITVGAPDPRLEPANVTVLAWVRRSGSPSVYRVIVGKGADGPFNPGPPQSGCGRRGQSYALSSGASGGIQFAVQLSTGSAQTPALSPGQIWDGQWHAVAGVYNGSSVSLWVDGELVGSSPASGAIDYGLVNKRLTFARWPQDSCDLSGFAFSGGLDEIRIYKRALSTTEIRYLQSDSATSPPNLPVPPGPVNVSRPRLSGTPAQGSALSCSQGSWTGSPTSFVYTWERAPRSTTAENDPAWGAINGASGTQYTVQAADVSSRVRCRVTATDALTRTGTAVSTSLRADVGASVNVAPPQIEGTPISGQTLTCKPGTWQSGPDFTYRWLRDGQPIAGATQSTYVPTRTRQLDIVVDAGGDADHQISCEVTGSNDVGTSAPARSDSVQPVDGPPQNVERPTVRLDLRLVRVALGQSAECEVGTWLDDYGKLGTAPYLYEFQWLRDGAPIAGATSGSYTTTVDDLGKRLSCRVVNSNPAGRSRPATSNSVLVPLPPGTAGGQMFKAGGRTELDPVNLLAASGDYLAAISGLTRERLRKAVEVETNRCRTDPTVPKAGVVPDRVRFPVNRNLRCRLLLRTPERVNVDSYFGVFYRRGGCGYFFRCPDLGFALPPVDPARPPAADLELQARLAPLTPVRILWDVDSNGTTDASCPGSAPVLRMLLDKGRWNARAVIVAADSAATGIFGEAKLQFGHPEDKEQDEDKEQELQRPRSAQPFACRTSVDPPPDEDKGPCLTEGTIGRVRVTGDLCPISVRAIPLNELRKNFPEDSEEYKVLKAIAEGISVEQHKASQIYGPPEPFAALRSFAPLSLKDRNLVAAAFNTQAAMTSMVGRELENKRPFLVQVADGGLLDKLDVKKLLNTEGWNENKAAFALDQIYMANGPIKVNGVTVDPNGTKPMIVPSDARQAIPSIGKSMRLVATDAQTKLGGVPLATEGPIRATLADAPTAADAVLRDRLDLDDLKLKLENEVEKFKLGPFKLAGKEAKVKLENDGTATLEAMAVLPVLTDPIGESLSVKIKLRGDLQGNLKLEGVKVRAPLALLGSVRLEDLFLEYDGGLTVQGKLLFLPNGEGIAINRFRLGRGGEFEALDLAYLAGSGSGIPVGPGVFMTRLQGGFNAEGAGTILSAGTTISAGPSPGGGCAAIGVDAQLTVAFAKVPAVAFDGEGNVQVICIPLVKIKFRADSSGYVAVSGGWDLSAGPLFYRSLLGGSFKDGVGWQIEFNGEGGIRDVPLIGELKAQLQGVLSNRGFAVCGSIKIFVTLSGGAGVRFPNGRPPLGLGELISNVRVFTGCDLSSYRSLPSIVGARAAQAGSRSFDVKSGPRVIALSFEGAGDAPRVRLRSPSGRVLDFTDAPDGKRIEGSYGAIVEQEDRTVVLLERPEVGRWTAEVASGSTAVVRVRQADMLPAAKVAGKVAGAGSSRLLTYSVAPLEGQEVRFVEVAAGARKALRTVKGGGKGSVRFQTSEARGSKRSIVAEVIQDGMPRKNLTIARFSAPSPRVGRPGRVRVRRRGKGALVTWTPAPLARYYDVSVAASDGGRIALAPRRGSRQVTVPSVGKKERLTIRVVGISASGRRGPAAIARLADGGRSKSKRKR